MARPRKQTADLNPLERLVGYGLTTARVATFLGVSARTLYRRQSDYAGVMAA